MRASILAATLLGLPLACQATTPRHIPDQPKATMGEPVAVTLAAGGVT